MKKGIIALLFFGWLTSNLFAASQGELVEILADIKSVRSEIQKSTTSFLLLTKQIGEGQSVTTIEMVQVAKPVVSIYESDLETSPLLTEALNGDEFLLLEKRNDWYKIELEDGREGWIHLNNIQLVDRELLRKDQGSPDPQIRTILEQFYKNILDQHNEAKILFEEFDELYEDLSSSEKTEAASIYSVYADEKEKIQTYLAYANHYHEKTFSNAFTGIAQAGVKRNEIGYQGTATMRLGTSSYKAATRQSTSSRNINLNGAVIFSPRSRLNINLNHNNDVVQTPYTSNDLNLNFNHLTESGTRFQGSVLYHSYNDEAFDRNNFQNVGLGARVDHPLSDKTRVFGDLKANSKTFDEKGGNGFEGAAFNSGLNFIGASTEANVGVRGRVQSSDVSFLDYTRLIPNAEVRWLMDSGSFGIRAEAEQLNYATEAEGNNFNRGRLDLQWAGGKSSTSLIAIAKQYPNNEVFDNYRLRLQNQWNKSSGVGTARTALSVQYVYHPQNDTQLTNYADLRFDRSSTGRKAYFDLNFFGRYWEDGTRDHSVDLFTRFGIKFSQFQIGPAIGARLLLNQDDLQIEQNGNSFRLGVDARANAAIQKAILYGSLRYQKSLVYNSEISINTSTGTITQGDIQSRMPTTIQFSAGVQVPIIDALDFKIDASYYNVDLDLSDEISINPVQTRTGLRVLGGISYRFQRN